MDLKKAIKCLGFFCLFFLTIFSYSQNTKEVTRCAADEYNELLLKKYPEMKKQREALEKRISKKIIEQSREQGGRRVVYTIPVVVHVIHNGEPIGTGANISDAQVLSQIQVLNEDFRRMIGTRGHNTHPDGADVEVEFCLAKQTPDGCTTSGINRIDMSGTSTSWSGPGGNTDTVLKPATIWDASKYMNMWSVNFSDNTLLGYAQFPGGPANTDGVVAGYQYFGTDDDPNVTIPGVFNLGRTMTHEVGHYLNLYHTFQGGCSETGGGDLCADTPPVAGPSSNNGTCNPGNDSCPTPPGFPDMVENYMDYSSDACMNVFTNDQKARVVATLTTASNRPTTLTSNVCNAPTPVNYDGSVAVEQIAVADCSSVGTPSIRVTNWGSTTMTSASISYDIDEGTPMNYNWSGSLAEGEYEIVSLPDVTGAPGSRVFNVSIANPNGNTDQRNCNDNDSATFNLFQSFASTTQVHLTLVPDDYGSEITWEFRDSGGALIDSGGPYTDGNTTPINESFNVSVDECYAFTIFDSANDGICCGFGSGSYELKADDNTVMASGGEFAGSEVAKISTITLGNNQYFRNDRVTIYPNPSTSELTIKLANGNDLPDAYEVYNLLGQTIVRKDIRHASDLKLDVSSMSNGMYFIKISKEGGAISLPFIKK